jgi:hypothetical protein
LPAYSTPFLVAVVALARRNYRLGLAAPIGSERFTDADLPIRELPVLVTAHIALIAPTGLNDFW